MRCMLKPVVIAALCGTGLAAPALAQAVAPQPLAQQQAPQAAGTGAQPAAAPKVTHVDVERKGRIGHDVFLGTYLSLDKECKVGAAPRIEFTTNPVGGKMRTRTNAINLRDVPGAPRRNCIGISPTGLAVIYRGERRFKGEEKIVFKVIYPNGDIREVNAKVVVE
jgi:hypothetical protein